MTVLPAPVGDFLDRPTEPIAGRLPLHHPVSPLRPAPVVRETEEVKRPRRWHSRSRSKRGYWVVKRKTAGNRFRRAVKKIADWCRKNRHLPIAEQYQTLKQKLQR